MSGQLLNNQEIVTQLDISHLDIEDDTPVDNFQSEAQQRLLVEPLYSSRVLPVWSISADGYTDLTPPQGISAIGQSVWLNAAGVGLTLWEGQFEEEVTRLWLRWCDRHGQVILTGAERADRLAERLRAIGINPDEV